MQLCEHCGDANILTFRSGHSSLRRVLAKWFSILMDYDGQRCRERVEHMAGLGLASTIAWADASQNITLDGGSHRAAGK